MMIHALVQSDLKENRRVALEQASHLWKTRMAGAYDLDNWFMFIPVLADGRNLCMKASNSNEPRGRRYNELWSAYHGLYFEGMPMPEVTALLWFGDHPEHMNKIATLRATNPKVRNEIKLPTSARSRIERDLRAIKAGNVDEDGEPKEPTWKEKYQAAADRVTKLEHDLARAEQDGSLFDLSNDSASAIATVIVGKLTAYKAREIAKQITALLKAKPEHAG